MFGQHATESTPLSSVYTVKVTMSVFSKKQNFSPVGCELFSHVKVS